LVLTGVVHQVRRVPADETRLELLRRVLRGRYLDGGVRVQIGELLTGELDVVGAIAAVEDDGIDADVLGHAERIVLTDVTGRLVGLVLATTTGGAGGERDAKWDGSS